MKKINLNTEFTVFPSINDVSAEVQTLMELAKNARSKAYSPYSKFNVGAAILLDNGEIVSGNNQENASYPSGLCAERTAIYAAGANYPDIKILKMAITARSQNKKTDFPIPPCGACRQVISEYETKQESPIEIYFMGEEGNVVKSDSLANLLPWIFDRSML